MKFAYPVIFEKSDGGYVVYVPDLKINTQGETLHEAICMGRDAISLLLITLQDEDKPFPLPSDIAEIKKDDESDIVTLIDVDLIEYRREFDTKFVNKNCTLPVWMKTMAERKGLSFSKILQDGIMKELGIDQ